MTLKNQLRRTNKFWVTFPVVFINFFISNNIGLFNPTQIGSMTNLLFPSLKRNKRKKFSRTREDHWIENEESQRFSILDFNIIRLEEIDLITLPKQSGLLSLYI